MKKLFTIILVLLSISIKICAQPGALDPGFGIEGKFTLTDNATGKVILEAYAMAIQPDGKILMAGPSHDYTDPFGTDDFGIIRLNTDGTIDNNFSDDGKAFVDFTTTDFGSADFPYKILVQPDGKILVIGFAFINYYIDATDTYNILDIALARLNADGTPDNSFDGDGKKMVDLSGITATGSGTHYSYDFAYDAAITSGGKICIAGYTYYSDDATMPNYDAVVLQLNNDGSLDNNFDGDGVKIVLKPDSEEVITGLIVQPDDKIVLSGFIVQTAIGSWDFLTIRLNSDGVPDNNFGDEGFAITDAGSSEEYGYGAVLQKDSKIVQGGRQYVNGSTALVLTRLNSDGTPDDSFDGDGVQTYFNTDESNWPGLRIALQEDGKIIQTGRTATNKYFQVNGSDNFFVSRYNTDGSPDLTFGNNGRSIIDFGNWTDLLTDYSNTCLVQPDGKIIAAGYGSSNINGTYYAGIAAIRLLVDGTIVQINGPDDQTATAAEGACSAAVNNIDPVTNPPGANVNYDLYGATTGTGSGTVSGMQFNTGVTTVVYTLEDNPLQRTVFTITVDGGTAAGALDFDGVDDRINLSNIYAITSGNYGEYSFEAWVKVHAYTNDDGVGSWIFGDESNGNGGIQVQLNTEGYIITFQPSVGFVVSSYQVSLDTWTHIAFVQSTQKLDLYVNGNFVQTLLTAPNLHMETYQASLLGAFSSDFGSYSRHFNGQIDEVRVWDRAICPGQILNNMNCEISGYAQGLVAYYKFNQGIASCNNPDISYLNGEPGFATLENFALNGSTSNWVAGYVSGSCAPFEALTLTCPGDITITLEPGQCGTNVDFAATASSGCSPDVTITYSHNPGTFFPTGTTYVDVTATDGFGNHTECFFTVTVKDAQPPVLVTKNASIALDANGNANLYSYFDVVESVTDDCTFAPGIYVYPSNFSCNNVGQNVVTVTAYDNGGNSTAGTAIVNVTPFVTSATVTVDPPVQQYSDPVTFKATLLNSESLYFIGCIAAPTVTIRLGSEVLDSLNLAPDFLGNLMAASTKTLGENLSSKKVTAAFSDPGSAVEFNNKSITFLTPAKEDAGVEYVASQLVRTACSNCTEAVIPAAALITDAVDGYPGDINNASVTLTITPATVGASVIGASSITVPKLSFVNSDNTSGVAKTNFKVSTGAENQRATFNISVKVDNYYNGSVKVPVIVTRGTSASIASSSKIRDTDGFDVTVLPNPSHDYYKLQIQSGNKYEKINIKVSDVTGRVIETKQNLRAGDIIKMGEQYRAGTYMAEIIQGQNRKVIKLIKL